MTRNNRPTLLLRTALKINSSYKYRLFGLLPRCQVKSAKNNCKIQSGAKIQNDTIRKSKLDMPRIEV